MDGQEGKTYEAINGIPEFSPDSKHLVYAAKQNGKFTVVIHDVDSPSFPTSGKEGKEYNIVGSTLTFSPDSKHLAYVARSEEHTSELQSQSNLVCRLLLEKKKSGTYP